jgi:hypothetical protein
MGLKEDRMTRKLLISTLALGLWACGGAARMPKKDQGGSGGDGGTGGAVMTEGMGGGGSGASGRGGASGKGGSGGEGGSSGSGGGAGSGMSGAGGPSGAGGSGGDQMDASMMSLDGPAMSLDASAGEVSDPGGASLPGKPWIHLCPKSYSHEQCCMFLCSCLSTICADSPADKAGVMNCMTACPKLSDMLLRCHVYHCYESENPNVPGDHASHCGHASGRVGGGGCPTAVYQ